MGRRIDKQTMDYEAAFSKAQDMLSEQAEAVREAAESLEESWPGTERAERYSEAADGLEVVDLEGDVPEALAHVPVVFVQDTRKGMGRKTQLANLQALVMALADAARAALDNVDEDEDEDEDEGEDVRDHVDLIEKAADDLENIEI